MTSSTALSHILVTWFSHTHTKELAFRYTTIQFLPTSPPEAGLFFIV